MQVLWIPKSQKDLQRINDFELKRSKQRATRVVNALLDEADELDRSLPVRKGTPLPVYLPREVYRIIVMKDYEMHYEINTAANAIYILDLWHVKENR